MGNLTLMALDIYSSAGLLEFYLSCDFCLLQRHLMFVTCETRLPKQMPPLFMELFRLCCLYLCWAVTKGLVDQVASDIFIIPLIIMYLSQSIVLIKHIVNGSRQCISDNTPLIQVHQVA